LESPFFYGELHFWWLQYTSSPRLHHAIGQPFQAIARLREGVIFLAGDIWGPWGFLKMEIPQNAWFTMKNPIKLMIWGYPLFQETSIYIYTRTYIIYIPIYIAIISSNSSTI
jgi:hypothetical protein